MTLMRGAALVVLTPQEVRQRSDTSRAAFELRSLAKATPVISRAFWDSAAPCGGGATAAALVPNDAPEAAQHRSLAPAEAS